MEVGRRVLAVAVHDGLVADEVVLDAVRVHEELDSRAPVVARVEHDAGEILVAVDVVAFDVLARMSCGRGSSHLIAT